MEATVHRPGEGETIGGATTVTIKTTGEDTDGSFYLGETLIEPGFVHTFSNRSDAAVRFLNLNTPAGWESYMRDLAATLARGTPTREEIGDIASRYDFEVA